MSFGDFGMNAAILFCSSVGLSMRSGSLMSNPFCASPPSAKRRRRPGADRPSSADVATPARTPTDANSAIKPMVISDMRSSVLDLDQLADDQRANALQHDAGDDQLDAQR